MDEFFRLYADHHRDVYRFALFLTRDAAEADGKAISAEPPDRTAGS